MNRNNRCVCSFALVVLTSVLLAGCGPPIKNVELEKAQASFAAAQMDPVVVKNAPLELQTAETSLQTAERLWKTDAKPAEVSHQAYLALQRTAIAKEIANQKVAEESVEAASSARAKVLLEARTYEADEATKSAELARRQAQEQATLLAVKTVEGHEAASAAEARAKQLEAEIAQLQAIKSERGLVITLGDVLFDTGRAELKGSAMVTISKVANFMRTYPTRTLLVEGFTDSRGSESYNLDLSQRRANAVRSALTTSGVEASRIAVRGYGESYSVASNETPVGRQLNRRVEVIISDEEGRIVERR